MVLNTVFGWKIAIMHQIYPILCKYFNRFSDKMVLSYTLSVNAML